jgi:hypothetical protein
MSGRSHWSVSSTPPGLTIESAASEDGSRSQNGSPEIQGEVERLIRRLDALEFFILIAAVFFALGGGALVAFLVSTGTELSFRPTWAVVSLLLFVVPGMAVLGRERRKRDRSGKNRSGTDRTEENRTEENRTEAERSETGRTELDRETRDSEDPPTHGA